MQGVVPDPQQPAVLATAQGPRGGVQLDELDGVPVQRDHVEQQQPAPAPLAFAVRLGAPGQGGKPDHSPGHVVERGRVPERVEDAVGPGRQLGLDADRAHVVLPAVIRLA